MTVDMKPPATYPLNQLGEVYETYYHRYRGSVYKRTYMRLLRDQFGSVKPAAEDLCQETFCGVYRWMRNYYETNGDYPPPEIFERVLRVIEVNEYRTYIKHARAANWVVQGPAPNEELAGLKMAHLQVIESTPEQELLWKEYQGKIHHCLKKLRSSESAALLFKLIGYSDREVARLLGEKEKRIMSSIIPLGRKKLRKCMEGYVNGTRRRGL